MSEVRVRLPLGALSSVWESLGIRLPWAQEIVSSNLTTLTALRWSSCWYEFRLKSGLTATKINCGVAEW